MKDIIQVKSGKSRMRGEGGVIIIMQMLIQSKVHALQKNSNCILHF